MLRPGGNTDRPGASPESRFGGHGHSATKAAITADTEDMAKQALMGIRRSRRQVCTQWLPGKQARRSLYLFINIAGHRQIVKQPGATIGWRTTCVQAALATDKSHCHLAAQRTPKDTPAIATNPRGNIHSHYGQTTEVDGIDDPGKGIADFAAKTCPQ